MKKLLLFALAAIMMAGCGEPPKEVGTIGDFSIVVVDSCEYLQASYVGGSSYFAHKGNCKFCKERRKAELREVVELLKDK